MGCANIHIDESTLEQIFIKSWKALMENKDVCVKKVAAVAERKESFDGISGVKSS